MNAPRVFTPAEVLREVQSKNPDESSGRPILTGTALPMKPHWRSEKAPASPTSAAPIVVEDCAKSSPPIVTLCGSTRFRRAFEAATYRLTLEGWAVLSVASFSREHDTEEARDALSDEQKRSLDTLHLRKVAMSRRVHVLNPAGYIGKSTASEIAFAFSLGLQITFLDEAAGNAWLEDNAHALGQLVAKGALDGRAR